MKLIVGLGNPGKQYEQTRHNVGFRVLDSLARQLRTRFSRDDIDKIEYEVAETIYEGEKVYLLKPLTYMNDSGVAVAKFSNFYKIVPSEIWVVSDDIDLPISIRSKNTNEIVGAVRSNLGGSSGGHKGLQSIIDKLGSDQFWRIRVGVRDIDYPVRGKEREKYVLSSLAIDRSNEIAETFLIGMLKRGIVNTTIWVTTKELIA